MNYLNLILIIFNCFFFLKFPNNIVLDFNTRIKINQKYWIIRYLLQQEFTINFSQKFLHCNKTNLIKNQKKFTLRYLNNNFLQSSPSKYNIKYSEYLNKEVYNFLTNKNNKTIFNIQWLQKIFVNYNFKTSTNFNNFSINKLINVFDVNFLRKEKIYTKLKYSRVPQYDAVSGGSAAILAGFLGYLITEKFGLELLDSGDFWFFFMYLVFIIFSCYPLLKIITDSDMGWSSFSYKWGFYFYFYLLLLIFKSFWEICNFFFSNFKNWIKKWK